MFSGKIKIYFVFLSAVMFFMVMFVLRLNAAVSPSIVSYQGKILENGISASTSLIMTFELFNTSTGGSALYATTNAVTPSSGLFSILLGDSGTTPLDSEIFKNNDVIYLQVTVEGQILSPRKHIVAVPYAFNTKYVNGLEATSTPTTTAYIPVADSGGNFTFNSVTTTGDVDVQGSLNVTQTSTVQNVVPQTNALFSLGSSIFKWLTGWFVNLFADEATIVSSTLINANIGTSTIENATITSSSITYLNAQNATTTNFYTNYLTVSNTIMAGQICDANGNNCFDPNVTGWGSTAKQMSTTTGVTNGYFATGTLRGYRAADNICRSQFTGYHFCTAEDIIKMIYDDNDISSFVGTAWIANGPPGYTANANDCIGWTTSSPSALGAFWEFENTTGGAGWLVNCSVTKPIACCK